MRRLDDVIAPSVNPSGDDVVRSNVLSCLERNLPEIFVSPEHSGELYIVGGGPSLSTQLDRLRIRKGPIWAINGAFNYLVKNGIQPECMLLLDASDFVLELIEPNPGVKYIVSSQCHPKVFDKLKDCNVVVWHASVKAGEDEIVMAHRKDWTMVGGGCTTALRAFNLGYVLGYRHFHLFGVDSANMDDQHHLYEQEWANENDIEVFLNGKRYITQPDFARQAQDFIEMLRYFGMMMEDKSMEQIYITVYGSGLIQDIAKDMGIPVVN